MECSGASVEAEKISEKMYTFNINTAYDRSYYYSTMKYVFNVKRFVFYGNKK